MHLWEIRNCEEDTMHVKDSEELKLIILLTQYSCSGTIEKNVRIATENPERVFCKHILFFLALLVSWPYQLNSIVFLQPFNVYVTASASHMSPSSFGCQCLELCKISLPCTPPYGRHFSGGSAFIVYLGTHLVFIYVVFSFVFFLFIFFFLLYSWFSARKDENQCSLVSFSKPQNWGTDTLDSHLFLYL